MILDPVPGYVIKTLEVATGTKVFINVCSDPQVECPATLDPNEIALQVTKGEDWVVPIVVSNGRQDSDKQGAPCLVFDCCLNPNVLLLGVQDASIKVLTDETCIELVEDRSGNSLSRDYKFPKMKKKGELERTVVNADMPHERTNKTLEQPSPEPQIDIKQGLSTNPPNTKKPLIEVVDEGGINFYMHLYRGEYKGGVKPAYVVEIYGLHPELTLQNSILSIGENKFDIKFIPSAYDSFYNESDQTTYVMLWK